MFAFVWAIMSMLSSFTSGSGGITDHMWGAKLRGRKDMVRIWKAVETVGYKCDCQNFSRDGSLEELESLG